MGGALCSKGEAGLGPRASISSTGASGVHSYARLSDIFNYIEDWSNYRTENITDKYLRLNLRVAADPPGCFLM